MAREPDPIVKVRNSDLRESVRLLAITSAELSALSGLSERTISRILAKQRVTSISAEKFASGISGRLQIEVSEIIKKINVMTHAQRSNKRKRRQV